MIVSGCVFARTGRWSESGSSSGINMYVAKNATHHYTSWWYISRLADFSYTDATDPDLEGHGLMGKVNVEDVPEEVRVAEAHVCLELATTEDETSCYSVDSGDSEDCTADSVGVSALVFSVLGFIAIVGFGVMILGEVRKTAEGGLTKGHTSSEKL